MPIEESGIHSVNTNVFFSAQFPIKEDCSLLTVSGYMPSHAHGLPTNPVLSRIDDSHCAIDGLFFNMPGIWKVRIKSDNEEITTFTFDAS
ncbi:hypothetical protein [Vibrio paucivorans]